MPPTNPLVWDARSASLPHLFVPAGKHCAASASVGDPLSSGVATRQFLRMPCSVDLKFHGYLPRPLRGRSFIVSKLTVMARRVSSRGYLGLFMAPVAQRLASWVMPLVYRLPFPHQELTLQFLRVQTLSVILFQSTYG